MTYINYNLGEIIENINGGIQTPEMIELYNQVMTYKATLNRRVDACIQVIGYIKPDNVKKWIYENVSEDIRYYVYQKLAGEEINVLMKGKNKWKTLVDIGLVVKSNISNKDKTESWFNYWTEQAIELESYRTDIYDTHAHYNLREFDEYRYQLLDLMHKSGVAKIVVPTIDYDTNNQIIKIFDNPGYEFVNYAFGNHPKYLGDELFTDENWDEFCKFLSHPKCVAIGEIGLDYSYPGFCEEQRIMQMNVFRKFIDIGNQFSLPIILHIRNSQIVGGCNYNATKDAFNILSCNRIKYGGVLHCFDGSISDIKKYMSLGIGFFGIGGKILYGNTELEDAVSIMPETSIVLETDSPYIKTGEKSIPNTSLSLGVIARKIAELRNTSVNHILQVTYENAEKLYKK